MKHALNNLVASQIVRLEGYRALRSVVAAQAIQHPNENVLILAREPTPHTDEGRLSEIVDRVSWAWREARCGLDLR